MSRLRVSFPDAFFWTRVAHTVRVDTGLPQRVVYAMLPMFERCLAIIPEKNVSMPASLDQVWHAALLETREYAALCAHLGHPEGIPHSTAGASDFPEELEYRRRNLAQMYAKRYDEALPAELFYPEELPLLGIRRQPARACKRAKYAEKPTHQLFVKGFTGKTMVFHVTDDVRGLDLKQMVYKKIGISVCKQRLIFAGKQLDDKRLLLTYGIDKESTIHLVLRLTGC